MKATEDAKSDLIKRFGLEDQATTTGEIQLKMVIIKRVFFGCTLLGSMIAYLWAFLPQL